MWKLLEEHPDQVFGSNLLLPVVLTEPVRMRTEEEYDALLEILARLTLIEVDDSVAMLSVELGAAYGLKTADAVHLASAAWIGADVFVTNNRRDFRADRVTEVDVRYPDQFGVFGD